MKHIGKVIVAFFMAVLLAGTSFLNIGVAITYSHEDANVVSNEHIQWFPGMAAELCVSNETVMPNGELESAPFAAGLFDLNNKEVLYGKNIHEVVQPASITKLLTALVALKYGTLDDKVTVSKNALITEYGAKLCGFYPGDDLTLEQALYGLLVYSGNDAGVVIAEHISGSVEEFSKLMNSEAKAIGATNTNFVNPHGLTAENHQTTIYDLYLIFAELMNYPKFLEIIQTKSYTYYPNNPTVVYAEVKEEVVSQNQTETNVGSDVMIETDESLVTATELPANQYIMVRKPVDRTQLIWENTNWFFTGEADSPENVTIIGGKTGTTSAAGACLILLVEGNDGNKYISVVMRAQNKPNLYLQMSDLLKEIVK